MSTEEKTIPDYLSPEWDAYVMEQFAPHELMDGHPNAAGLRRVAELLLGPIIESGPTQVFPSEGNGPTRAPLYLVLPSTGTTLGRQESILKLPTCGTGTQTRCSQLMLSLLLQPEQKDVL